jgi:hypothetical protein
MSTNNETYSQALERIYSREGGERVGNKEFLLQCIEDGDFNTIGYLPSMSVDGVSEEDFKAAQERGKAKSLVQRAKT